jgi:hypothetical protein
MLCVPAVNALVAHWAVRVLPDPPSATALQPASELPLSVKLTVPIGALPVTLAVKITIVPRADGLAELASVVVVGNGPAEFTICDKLALLDAVLPTSPPYDATML